MQAKSCGLSVQLKFKQNQDATLRGGVFLLKDPHVIRAHNRRSFPGDAADRAAHIEWEYATEFNRSWPALLAMQSALGLTDKQLDDLFTLAATL